MQAGQIVFIADDDDFAAGVIQQLLGTMKLEAQIFKNGPSLIQAYKAKNGAGIKFIIMDIIMPDMDGYATTKEIRSFEKSKSLPPIKIYGLSGINDAKTIAACKSVGMDDLFYKPLKKDKLLSII